MVQAFALKALAAGQADKAIAAIKSYTGKDEKTIRAALGQASADVASTRAGMFTTKATAAFTAAGADAVGFASTGTMAGSTMGTSAGQNAALGQLMNPQMNLTRAPGADHTTEFDKIEAAKAKTVETAENQSYKTVQDKLGDIGKTVSESIADGFVKIADEIRKKTATVTAPKPMPTVLGPGGNNFSQK
jgi:hypothetical protein